jgi:hypothetical protein
MFNMDYYELEYNGKMISINDAKSLHWRALKKKVDAIEIEFKKIIRGANPPKYDKFEVEVEYYNRYDVDNISFTVKCMIDQLVREKKLIDDNKKHWERLTITANRELKNNTIIFRIIQR